MSEAVTTVEAGRITIEAEVDGKTYVVTGNARNIAIKGTREEYMQNTWSTGQIRYSSPMTYSMDFEPDDDGHFLKIKTYDDTLEVEQTMSVHIVPTSENIENARIRMGVPPTARVSMPMSSGGYILNGVQQYYSPQNDKREVVFTWTKRM